MRVAKLVMLSMSAAMFAGGPASADSLSGVEGARAKERAGRYLNGEEIRLLNRWGGNDDHPLYYSDEPDYVPAPYSPYGPGYADEDYEEDDQY